MQFFHRISCHAAPDVKGDVYISRDDNGLILEISGVKLVIEIDEYSTPKFFPLDENNGATKAYTISDQGNFEEKRF